MIQVIGYAGSVGAGLMWLPQVVRVVRLCGSSALDGISVVAYLIAAVFNVLLISYGVVQDAVPVVLAGSVNLCCAAVIAGTLLTSSRRVR